MDGNSYWIKNGTGFLYEVEDGIWDGNGKRDMGGVGGILRRLLWSTEVDLSCEMVESGAQRGVLIGCVQSRRIFIYSIIKIFTFWRFMLFYYFMKRGGGVVGLESGFKPATTEFLRDDLFLGFFIIGRIAPLLK